MIARSAGTPTDAEKFQRSSSPYFGYQAKLKHLSQVKSLAGVLHHNFSQLCRESDNHLAFDAGTSFMNAPEAAPLKIQVQVILFALRDSLCIPADLEPNYRR